MGALKDKTVFITGASRGIGLAIAKRCAQDGANIVIAAKTAEPHPRLPGTIHTAAKECEQAGGQALAVQVDLRSEEQVQAGVAQAVEHFGGIDVLVNNASAISLTGTLETPMKRFDLMHQVNTRGTFLASQACLPHLLKGTHSHILNISPPLTMSERWFAPHVAYTMAKYGMSMCVLGMAGEFRGKVAVNALWPRTAIDTVALRMLGGMVQPKNCRTPAIMSDAAYAILRRDPSDRTGEFLIDDDVLRDEGVDDFTRYAVDPSEELLPDFFID
ncbi:MAG: NAD(P)-dependent oxidoreductase [Myxococcota bacterium]